MAINNELHHFFTSHRAKITPRMAGLKVSNETRKVNGLRREEVAALAGISLEYYKRIERGRVGNISEGVFEGLARALQLDDAARDYLRQLIREYNLPRAHTEQATAPQTHVRPAIAQALGSMSFPAYLRNNRFDILAANDLTRRLYSPIYSFAGESRPNLARYMFLSPTAPDFYTDYERTTSEFVSVLRSEVGQAPNDRALLGLVSQLQESSETFVRAWSMYNVSYHCSGPKTLNHPRVGELTMNYEIFDLPNDNGQRLNIYTYAQGSTAEAKIDQLAHLSPAEI